MKRTLAIVIAVLMVLVLIPTTVFAAPAPGDPGDPGDPGSGTGSNTAAAPAQPTPDFTTDFIEVLDENGEHVGFYPDGNGGLQAADNALQDGYTLAILQPITLTEPYVWGAGRGAATPISYTINGTGRLPDAGAAPVAGAWVFGNSCPLDKVLLDNVTLGVATGTALTVSASGAGNTVSVTLVGCSLTGEVALETSGVLAANTGAAVQVLDGNTLVGTQNAVVNGASMLIAGADTTVVGAENAVVNTGKLYVSGGSLVGGANAGVLVNGGIVNLAGATVMVNGTVYNGGDPVAAVKVTAGEVNLLGAMLSAPEQVVGATEEAAPITDDIYALYTADASFVHIYSMTALCAAGDWSNVAIAPASDYSAVSGTANMAIVSVGDNTNAEAAITVGDPAVVVAAFDLADATDIATLNSAMQLVPHGGTLELRIDLNVANSPHLFDYMPEMDVTLEGAKAGADPVVDFASTIASGVAAFYTSAHVTVKNVTFRASANAIMLMYNAAYGVLTIDEGAAIVNEKDDPAAVVANMNTATTLVVAAGGRIQSTASLISLAAGATFRLDGGEMEITSTALGSSNVIVPGAAAGFTAVTTQAKVELLSGDVWTIGGPNYVMAETAVANVPAFEIGSVRFLATVHGANAEDYAVTFTDNSVTLLDANGEPVADYPTITDALADVEDGYTVKVNGNHLETKWMADAHSDISWTLDGDLGNGERANVYALRISGAGDVAGNSAVRLTGSNTNIVFSNLVLYSMNNVIGAAASNNLQLTLDNVFMYAGGATTRDGSTGVASANNREYAMYIAANNSVRITGENSGSYTYYNGSVALDYQWQSFRNAGTLVIEDGFYTNPFSNGYIVATRDGASKTVITGGTFWASDPTGGSLFTVYGGTANTSTATMASLLVAGGTFVSNGGNVLASMNGGSNHCYLTVTGGKFYTNKDASLMAGIGNAPYTLWNFTGGEFYFQGTGEPLPAAGTGSTGNTTLAESGLAVATGGANAVRYGLYDTTYALGAAEENYVPTSGAGDPMELLTRDTYTKRVVSQTSAAVDPNAADVKVYAQAGDTDPVYCFAGPTSAYEAVMATYGMDSAVIELQGDCAMPDGVTLTMTDFGPFHEVTLTSAGDTPVVLSLNAASPMTFSGHTILDNVKIENAGGPAIGVAGTGAVLELKGAEISGVATVAARSTLVVDENSCIYATGAVALVTVQGGGNAHIYGKLGYDTNGIVAGLTNSAITVQNPSATLHSVIHVYGTAVVASTATGNALFRMRANDGSSSGYNALYALDVIVDDGATLESAHRFFDFYYGAVTVGNVHLCAPDGLHSPTAAPYIFCLQGVNSLTVTNLTVEPAGTATIPFYVACEVDINSGLTPTVTLTDVTVHGVLQTANAYYAYIKNCNVYMTRVDLEMANNSSNSVYGVRCWGSDVASGDNRLEAVFTDCRWVFNDNVSNTLMYLYGYMDYTFEGENGYYDMTKNGQVMSCLGATNPGGTITINGGTFAKKGATQGGINISGSGINMVINDGLFDFDKSTIFGLSAADTHLTINGGTFYRDGVLGSFIAISNGGTANVNGGTVIMGTKPITLNTSYDSMLFSVTHADAVLNVNGGDFLVNLDAFTNKIRAIMLMTAGTFNMAGGNILVRGSEAGNATLQDGICLQNHSYFNMSGGTITFEGQIAGTYHMIWTQGGYDASQSEIHLSGNAHIVADYVPVAGSAGNTGNHGMGIFYLRNGTPTFTMEGDVVLESRSRGCTLTNSAVLEPMANATVTINGGYIYDYNGGSAIHLWRGANVTINGGYFESNGLAALYADSWAADGGTDYNGALPHGFTVNGGTFVLQPSASFRAVSNNDSVVWVAVNVINLNGGIFINNSLTSTQVINRTATGGTMMIRGGLIMASQAQSFFFKTVNGYSGGADYRPRASVSVIATSAPLVRYAGRNYYLYGSAMGNLLAPEVDPSAGVRLYTDGDGNSHDGLLFTSTIKAAVFAALDTEVSENKIAEYPGATAYTIEYGTLVAPLDNILKTNGDFSAAAFAAYNATADASNQLPYVVIPAVNGVTVEASGDIRIRAALVGIDEDHYETFYTAQPYARITFLDNDTDCNPIGEPWVIYPNFNTNRSVASLSAVCARELRDIKAVREGEYLYRCTSASGAYSRYSAAQQAKLQSYVAHTHDYGHTGVCSICGDDLSVVLAADQATTIYSAFGSVAYYKVHLTAGVPYAVRLSNTKAGSYTLYDADGKACTFVDGKFTCPANGDYCLVFTGNALAITTLAISHVHNAGYTGYCSICDENQSVAIAVGERREITVIKGETYYFNAALVPNDYTFVTVNGNYTVYDSNGNVVPTENNVFTAAQAGTYYFVVTATFSAKGSVYLEHVHNFGYTGVCSYPGCGESVSNDLAPYARYSASHRNGDTIYFRIVVPAGLGSDSVDGRRFTFTFGSAFVGTQALYDADGTRVSASGGGYPMNSGATYYLVVGVQYSGTLEVTLGYTHDHTYGHDGICTICHTYAATWSQATLDQPMSAKYASDKTYYYSIANIGAGTDLTVTFSDGPTPWELYDANDNKVYDNTMGDTYTVTTAGAYNLVVTPTAASTAGATLTLATAATP